MNACGATPLEAANQHQVCSNLMVQESRPQLENSAISVNTRRQLGFEAWHVFELRLFHQLLAFSRPIRLAKDRMGSRIDAIG